MHANDDSLGVRSASVSGSDAEGRPFEVRQSARPTFFIWSHYDCGHHFWRLSRGMAGSLWIKSPCVASGSQNAVVLLAQSGHPDGLNRCPLLGVKQTSV